METTLQKIVFADNLIAVAKTAKVASWKVNVKHKIKFCTLFTRTKDVKNIINLPVWFGLARVHYTLKYGHPSNHHTSQKGSHFRIQYISSITVLLHKLSNFRQFGEPTCIACITLVTFVTVPSHCRDYSSPCGVLGTYRSIFNISQLICLSRILPLLITTPISRMILVH